MATAAGLWAGVASGQLVTNNFSFAVNQAVPDGNWNGLALSTNLVGMSGEIADVSVTLNLAGGFNGDLYAYLVHGTGFAVLLNQVGLSSSNSFGYADPGMTGLVLRDTAASDIHFYGGNGGLSLTGAYQPDGREVNPGTTPAGSYDAAGRSALLSSFQGGSPDGTWILYLADLSAGQASTLVSWDVQIVDVPEPATWTLAALGGLLVLLRRARFMGRRSVRS